MAANENIPPRSGEQVETVTAISLFQRGLSYQEVIAQLQAKYSWLSDDQAHSRAQDAANGIQAAQNLTLGEGSPTSPEGEPIDQLDKIQEVVFRVRFPDNPDGSERIRTIRVSAEGKSFHDMLDEVHTTLDYWESNGGHSVSGSVGGQIWASYAIFSPEE
jgi:hypothetical protein